MVSKVGFRYIHSQTASVLCSMGSAASVLPSRMDEKLSKSTIEDLYFVSNAGPQWNELLASENDTAMEKEISSTSFIEYVKSSFDVFLSHDWGRDSLNHRKIKK